VSDEKKPEITAGDFIERVNAMLNRPTALMGVEDTVRMYFALAYGLADDEARPIVAAAFERARAKRPDLDEYRSALKIAAGAVLPDFRGRIVGAMLDATLPPLQVSPDIESLDQYIEILYAVAKHADFLSFRDPKDVIQ